MNTSPDYNILVYKYTSFGGQWPVTSQYPGP